MLNYKNYAIMESLKELNEKCMLIAEFNNPAFVTEFYNRPTLYKRKTKCAIYTDKKGKYYLYKYINKAKIQEYDDYKMATEEFITFININIVQ